jgi:lysophospholipase L1-like esterase
MKLPTSSTLLFIGDSITDAGRNPTGEVSPWEANHGLGTGYVSLIHGWLQAAHPEARIRVVNKGTSGHTVRDLSARWKTDVLDLKPDVLCVMIGINDVWRQFDSPLRPELGVGLEEYRDTLRRLVREASTQTRQIFLASPFFIEPNRSDAMRARMDEYGAIVREIASQQGAHFVNVQAGFDTALAHQHSSALAWDRVHPGPAGHQIVARAFLQAFGCLSADV